MDNPLISDLPGLDRLSPADEEALDRLADEGFDPTASQAADSRARSLRGLLDLLDTPGADPDSRSREVLIDVVMARVQRSGRPGSVAAIGEQHEPLSGADTEALDDLVETQWTSVNTTPRSAAAAELLELLTVEPALDGDKRRSLVARTLDRVQDQIDRGSWRMRLDPAPEGIRRPSGLKLADLAAVAAVVLIGTAVLWPMLVNLRERARIASGASNLNGAAMGFTLYAGDHDDRLPQTNASFLRGRWWDVGVPERSHSANLFTLVRSGYTSMRELSSPGNPDAPARQTDPSARDWRRPEEVSFSYQLFSVAPQWGEDPRMVVLTDRSPVVDRARRGEAIDPEATSLNHKGWGQHVLFADGSVVFIRRPVLESGDNLWIPGSLEGQDGSLELLGNERPDGPRDAFVGP